MYVFVRNVIFFFLGAISSKMHILIFISQSFAFLESKENMNVYPVKKIYVNSVDLLRFFRSEIHTKLCKRCDPGISFAEGVRHEKYGWHIVFLMQDDAFIRDPWTFIKRERKKERKWERKLSEKKVAVICSEVSSM